MNNSRRMLYPYTLTAKLLQFPAKHYYNNNTYFKSWVWAVIILLPLMYKVQRASFSPGVVEKREQRLKRDHEEYLEHLKHLR